MLPRIQMIHQLPRRADAYLRYTEVIDGKLFLMRFSDP
jgi:hypothetical protein